MEVELSEDYQHTQVGIVTTIVILLSAACTAFALIPALQSADGQTATLLIITSLVVTGVFILVLVALNAFTIQIADDTVTFWLGCGNTRQSLPKEAIRSVEIVRNPWHYSWGIKSIPGGWLCSVAPGRQSIELALKDHRKIRLGTNRAEEIKLRSRQIMERPT